MKNKKKIYKVTFYDSEAIGSEEVVSRTVTMTEEQLEGFYVARMLVNSNPQYYLEHEEVE